MRVDMKFEVAIVPVSDVDRAKAFYTKLGWRVDDDIVNGADFRAVQLTPPGSAASLTFGQGVTDAKPGSFRGGLIVKDILAAHEDIVASGIEATELCSDSLDGRSHISGRANVHAYGKRAAAGSHGRRLQCFLIDVEHGHLDTRARERPCHFEPDSGRRSGYRDSRHLQRPSIWAAVSAAHR